MFLKKSELSVYTKVIETRYDALSDFIVNSLGKIKNLWMVVFIWNFDLECFDYFLLIFYSISIIFQIKIVECLEAFCALTKHFDIGRFNTQSGLISRGKIFQAMTSEVFIVED